MAKRKDYSNRFIFLRAFCHRYLRMNRPSSLETILLSDFKADWKYPLKMEKNIAGFPKFLLILRADTKLIRYPYLIR